MARFCIEKLHPNAPSQQDVLGKRVTIVLPEQPDDVVTWSDFIKWLRDNPPAFSAVHGATITLTTAFGPLKKSH